MASEKKKSNSKGHSSTAKQSSSDPRPSRQVRPSGHFAICVRNDDYPASLELRKLYPILDDEFGNQHGMVRIVDESGEDYLFPRDYFVRVTLPQAIEKRLLKIA